MRRQPPVERAQERPALALVMLPGVLAVEDHEDGRLLPPVRAVYRAPGFDEPADEVVGGRVRPTRRVGEADQIRQV